MRRFAAALLLALFVAPLATSAVAEVRRSGCDQDTLAPDKRRNGGESASSPALDHYYALSHRMRAAFEGPTPDAAKPIAEEYLRAASEFPCNWDYGNAIHNAHTVLGLLALKDGRRADAVAHLRAAGTSPGSPQLDSFGPSLLLARDLAQAGEYDAVADYLLAIRRFWKARDDSLVGMLLPIFADPDPIGTWVAQLRRHHEPGFGLMQLHTP